MPPKEITAVSEVPPPMSITMLPTGSSIGRSAPIAAAIGCSIRLASAAPARRAASVTARRSTSVIADGHADDDLRSSEPAHPDTLEQQSDHPLGDLEVGDRTATQRTDRDDVAGGATDHLPRLATRREHLAGLSVECDHRRLVQDDAAALHVDQRVRRSQVDGEVTSHGRALSCLDGAACRAHHVAGSTQPHQVQESSSPVSPESSAASRT